MSKYEQIDLEKVKSTSIEKRKSKLDIKQQARPFIPGSSFRAFLDSLPLVLASRDFSDLVDQIVRAVRIKKPILFLMGAHVVKTGLNPVVVDLLKNGIIQGVAFNGAGAIHDIELSYFGKTSEDVSASIKSGEFGMARETAEIINQTVRMGLQDGLGFGEVLGKRITEEKPRYADQSILGQAYQLDVPVTVHVAVGTDIVHQHPSADGAAIGEMSLRDFKILSKKVSQIGDGGVVLLFGSAVILPEVFLKALTVARNVTGKIENFTTASFDMIRHYRPKMNVVERPTRESGKGYTFVGHHELLIPLLAAAVKERLVVR